MLGAAPRRAVIRETSDPGDIIILLGGRTGRDGCGGATGSSKVHTEESIETCGAEVQKGNPPTERKIQRLFRREEVSCLIKKCNDFGAGGVSVAIGELAEGLRVDLDKVPKKYAGLDGTEIAILGIPGAYGCCGRSKRCGTVPCICGGRESGSDTGCCRYRVSATCPCMERKRDREYFPRISGYKRGASGDGCGSGRSHPEKILCS